MDHLTPATHPPPPPFPPHIIALHPLEFVRALIAMLTLSALIYCIFMSGCTFCRRRTAQNAPELSVSSDDNTKVDNAASIFDLKYSTDAHVIEIGSDCPVCLEVFSDGEKLRLLSCCKHYFHAECIDLWLRNRLTCPICRATVSDKRRSLSVSAPARNNDMMQVLPDASSLV